MKYLYLILPALFIAFTSPAQWNSNIAQNLEIAPQLTADMQTATTSDGKTWIAWYHNNAGNYDMRAQLLDANGNRLLGPDGVLVSNQTSGSATYVFNICLDASGNLVIGYQVQLASVMTAIVSKVLQNGTLAWGATGITLGTGLSPYAAVLTTGETVVAWNNTSPSTTYMQKITTGGTTGWGSPIAVQVGATLTTRSQVVPISNGNFTLIIQRKGTGISSTLFAQKYSSEGVAAWAAPIQISTLTTSAARYYSVTAEVDTTYVGYYASSGSRFFSYVQRVNPDGTIPYGASGSVFSTYSTGTEPYQQTTNIAQAVGSPYVWALCTYSNTGQSQYGIYVQKYDKVTGNKLFNALGKEIYPISTNFDTQAGTVALVNDAPAFMHYDVNYKIYATRLSSLGDFVWPTNFVQLSSTTAGGSTPKGRFNFTYLANNQGVATWYEDRGSGYRGYAQNITAAGTTGVLPVKLNDFSARRNGRSIELNWKTFSEANNKGFYIERSSDGTRFNTLQFVASKSVNGTSNTALNYALTDQQPLAENNYYRLKQVDLDGKSDYSKTVVVKYSKTSSLVIIKAIINTTGTILNVDIDADNAAATSISVVDLQGRIVLQKMDNIQAGTNTLTLDISALAKGMYVLKLQSNSSKELVSIKWMKP
jgi:hypothetical protein